MKGGSSYFFGVRVLLSELKIIKLPSGITVSLKCGDIAGHVSIVALWATHEVHRET